MSAAAQSTDAMVAMDEMDELDQISRVALYIDDLSNEDPSAKLHSIKRLNQIAHLLGPERVIEELIPMLTELIDKIDCNPELMMNLAEQLGLLAAYVGSDANSVHLLKPLELILPADDSVVRERAVASLKIVGQKISQQDVYQEYMPMVKRMRKGDLFSMRISACFLYAQIYGRLDDIRREYTRFKFQKLARDDTPMVRRGAAQSIATLAEFIEPEFSAPYLVPLLRSLLQDDNDSVKIMAVYSSVAVVERQLVGKTELVRQEIIPPLKSAVENKMVSWRLRFSVAEVAAQMSAHLTPEVVDMDVVPLYENLIVDKEPEVKSETLSKLHELSKHASPARLVEKLVPSLLGVATNDTSQHVRASLALSVCKIAKHLGKQHTLQYLIPTVVQLLKDQATEVRIELMSHLRTLTEVIGTEEFDKHIIPQLVQLSTDKIWRVKLALIHFMPKLALFLDPQLFKERLEPVLMGLLSDPVFQIREEAINLLLQLKESGSGPFTMQWLEDLLEQKAKEFHTHEKFAQRIHTIFLVQRVSGKVSQRYLNDKLFPLVLKLSDDPVPNIKFNFAKLVEAIYGRLTPQNQQRSEDALVKMIEQEQVDFDVRFYAERALKTVTM